MMNPSAIIAFQLRSSIIDRPLTVGLETTVLDAIAQMNRGGQLEDLDFSKNNPAPTSCVLVVENDRVLGIFTHRDVVQLIAQTQILDGLIMGNVMNHPVISLPEEEFTDLSVAVDLLCQHRISHLPLLDSQGCLIGLLTRESLQQRSHPNERWRQLISKLERELVDREIAKELLENRNQQLAMTAEEATRATQLKDEFLTNMSHELRTPLNAILGMAEGIQEGIFGATTPAQVDATKTIIDGSNHLLALIDDILDIAKIGADRIELECAPTDLHELCYASVSFVKQQAVKKQIRMQVQLPSRLPTISIDERRIRQVLINLLNNAVKFTPIGGHIALHVTIEADDISSNLVRMAVVDTGIGISSTDLHKLFQPFVRVNSALNRQYNGAGLGLALVKGIVEMHGGKVQVRSEIGVGSQFIVDLPIPQDASDLVVTAMPQLPGFSQTTAQAADLLNDELAAGRSWKILLAEDNEANISSISGFLKAKGYETILARNGLEALNLVKSQRPDLILMDIQMPKMDGLEAIRHIRNDLQLVHIPIVAVTALAMQGDREKCLSAGASEYLTKPVRLKQLSTTIQQFLVDRN